MDTLLREFYMQDTLDVAKKLLGKFLVFRRGYESLVGRIVETEGYMGPSDKGAHSYNNKRTPRTEIMYGQPGMAYVFVIYGMYNCLNAVTADIDKPEAVLIRAVEPVSGLEAMAENRYKTEYNKLTDRQLTDMSNGPGKLCKAFGIDRSNNGDDLCGSKLFITEGEEKEDFVIESSPRINIGYAEEARFYPWRFYIKGNRFVSRGKHALN